MTSAPKCKLCGAQHWANQPHAWEGSRKPERPPAPAKPSPKKPEAPPEAEMARLLALDAANKKRLAKNAAYMRAYRANRKDD